MKILFIDEPLEPPGGGQISLLNVLKYIDKNIYRIKVFLRTGGTFERLIREHNIDFEVVDIKNLFSKIKDFDPQIIHVNSAAGKYTFFSVLFSKFLGKRVIWHNRVAESSFLREFLISALVDKVIVISDAVKEKFSYLNDKKVIKLYNPIDFNSLKVNLKKNLREMLKIPHNAFVVGIFSRFDEWKGHKMLFEAFVDINKENVYLIVCGDGKMKKDLMLFVDKLNIKEKVIFCGYVENVYDYMNICDIVVNSSIKPEGFGRIIVEAMALGKIVISTNIGGPYEIIKNGVDGFLVPVDKIFFSRVLNYVLNNFFDEKIQIIRKNAVEKAKEFNITDYLKKLYNVYREVL